jgi:D-glycero-D-manno-heptose 1,7-bisphosphate phosphatase
VVSGGAKAVFLDRDGVVVVPDFRDGRSYAPTTIEAFKVYPEARAGLEALRKAGYLLVVVTNQPDVGKGLISEATLTAMHERLAADLPVDRIEVCRHTREDACDCRKPKAGMLLRAAEDLGIDLDRSFMIGDRESDVLAGRAAGCRTVFIDLDYTSEPRPSQVDWSVRSISEAVQVILGAAGLKEKVHVSAR